MYRASHCPLLCLAAIVTMVAGNLMAQEQVLVNLDYNSGFSNATQSGAAVVGSAGDFWNASPTFFGFQGTETPSGNTGNTPPFGATELNDTSGSPSGIFYQMTFVNDGFGFNGAFENFGAVAAPGVANLLGDYAFVGEADGGEALDFELSGLEPNTQYSLYLYGNGDQEGQGCVWTLDGASQTSAFDGTSTLDEGGEYALFTFNTGTDTTQTFSATELTTGIAVNGFQLTTPMMKSLLGDVNCDGNVDLLDVSPFVQLITSGEFSTKADINGDGAVDLLDIGPFVELLTE